MPSLGTVTGQEIKTNRNGEVDVRLLQVQFSNERDIQTVQHFNPSGEDSAPINGDEVIVFEIGAAFKVAVATQDALAAVMGAGEKKLYSRDSGGAIAAFINLLAGGNLELNGNSRSAVGYDDLVTEFNELKSAFNSHTHSGVTSGGASTGAATPQSAADITTTEVPTVKVP
jgi:phage gp45-like